MFCENHMLPVSMSIYLFMIAEAIAQKQFMTPTSYFQDKSTIHGTCAL